MEAGLAFDRLGEGGMAYDFTDAKLHLRAIADSLDPENLNDLPPFVEMETSAENQARYIFEELRRRMGPDGEHVLYVRVWETPNQWAQYSEKTLFF